MALRAATLGWRPLARAALGGGFLALAAASFLHGSLVVDDADAAVVVGLRTLAVVGIVTGAVLWREQRRVRIVLGAAAALLAVSIPLGDTGAGSVVLAAGGVVLGVALLDASRRAVAARVAATAAATLLVLVLVLSVALSAVLSATVEREEVDQIETRALAEATEVEDTVRDEVVPAARLVASSLEGDRIGELVRLSAAPAPDPEIQRRLDDLTRLFLADRSLAYVSLDGAVIASTGAEAAATAAELTRTPVVAATLRAASAAAGQPLAARPERSTVAVAAGRAFAVAITVTGGRGEGGGFRPLGAILAVRAFDDDYLEEQRRDAAGGAFAIVSSTEVLATAGRPPSLAALRRAGRTVLTGQGSALARLVGDDYLAARRISDGDGRPVAAMVVSTPASDVERTRETLFQTLFLIALGGTLLALLLAAFVGDRIGSGLRRLTRAAGSIGEGDLDTRVNIRSDDEVGVLGAAFDSMVGSLQEKNEALRVAATEEARLRNRLEAIVEGMAEALLAVDCEGVVTDVNRAGEELLGFRRETITGRRLEEVVALRHEDDFSDLVARIAAVEPQPWLAPGMLALDAEEVPVAVTAGPLLDVTGTTSGAVALLRDLREERAVEQMKREFLSRVGHELRTPLTIINGYARTLASRNVPADTAADWYATMVRKGRELERIIQMLEFFAASGGGATQLRPEHVDVASVVRTAATGWSERLAGTPLSVRIGRRLPPVVSDRVWLGRSVDELIDNAVKFSDGGPVKLSVRAHRDEVVITVSDTGRGMTEEELERAFVDFVQGDTSDTRHYGGLGLGLSLVQRVVEAQGGSVRVESELGKGTKVSLVLPAARDHRSEDAAP